MRVLSVMGDVLGWEGKTGRAEIEALQAYHAPVSTAAILTTAALRLQNVVALPNRRTNFGNHADEDDGDHERQQEIPTVQGEPTREQARKESLVLRGAQGCFAGRVRGAYFVRFFIDFFLVCLCIHLGPDHQHDLNQ